MTHSAPTSRDALETVQLSQLRSLLAQLLAGNRFYTPILRATGITADIDSIDTFRRLMPLTTKSQIAEDQTTSPPYGTNLTFPIERYTRLHQTSGTTAAPLRWLDTPQSWQWMLDNWKRVYGAAGVEPGDRLFFAFSYGPFLGFWVAFEAANQLGCLCIPGGGMSSLARLNTILENSATVLCCTPTYAIRLAEVATENGIDLANSAVRAIIVAGEPGGSVPAIRNLIETRWPGAKIYDHHGMTEVGPVSYPCTQRPGVLHVIESAYLAEVIDPRTLAAVPTGELGELVLTTLGRTGSPLLRYRTGDLVRVDNKPCPCNSLDISLDGGILARCDDMVVIRGVNVYPSAVDQIVRGIAGTAEYRVLIEQNGTMTQMSIEIESNDGVAARLESDLRGALSLRVPVRCVAPGSLPRSEFKSQRWIRGQPSRGTTR